MLCGYKTIENMFTRCHIIEPILGSLNHLRLGSLCHINYAIFGHLGLSRLCLNFPMSLTPPHVLLGAWTI